MIYIGQFVQRNLTIAVAYLPYCRTLITTEMLAFLSKYQKISNDSDLINENTTLYKV